MVFFGRVSHPTELGNVVDRVIDDGQESDKSVLAKWLGDVIRAEMEKTVEEINWELVDECEAYLAELYSDIRISEEQNA